MKVLGIGGFGMAGLLKYTRLNPETPEHIVVKQCWPAEELQYESKLLRQCSETGTEHIIELLKSNHREPGTGTSKDFDPFPFNEIEEYRPDREVSGIFLEYCPGGDLDAYMKAYNNGKDGRIGKSLSTDMSEELIWRTWDCIARACLVLEQG